MAEITISHKGSTVVVLVDDADLPLLAGWSLTLHDKGYVLAQRGGRDRRERIYLHRLLLSPPSSLQCDHLNGVRTDNRRCNLRIVDQTTNNFNAALRRDNTHGHRGISLHKRSGLWQARITIRGRRHNLGYFKTAEAASTRYRAAAEGFGLILRKDGVSSPSSGPGHHPSDSPR